MFGFNPFRRPQSSFERPVPLVLIDPDEQADYSVCFNRAWLPYIIGSLTQLSLETTWKTDDPEALALQLGRVNLLISLFIQGCPEIDNSGVFIEDDMPQMRQTGCKLEVQCANGDWETLYDPTNCIHEAIQHAGAPTPLGTPANDTHVSDCPVLLGSALYKFPAKVQPGDTITITNATGGWAGSSNIGQIWACPGGDGYLLGACTGVPQSNAGAGAPIPGSPQMLLVAYYDGHYYPAFNTTIVLPVDGQQSELLFLANDADLSDNQGSVTFCVDVLHPAPIVVPPEDFSAYDWAIALDLEHVDYHSVIFANSANGNDPRGYVVGTGVQSGLGGNFVNAFIGLSLPAGHAYIEKIIVEGDTVFNEQNAPGGAGVDKLNIVLHDNVVDRPAKEDTTMFSTSLHDKKFITYTADEVQINPGFVTQVIVSLFGKQPTGVGSDTSNVIIRKVWIAGHGNIPGVVHT